MAISLPDTAFVIACYRANNETESRDPFARLWVKPGLQAWIADFSEKVSEYDEILHCMRNRIFHDILAEINQTGEPVLCINLGAGFSMYPYSMPDSMVTIEADFNDVATYKREAIDGFLEKGELPMRKVVHVAADITKSEDQKRLRRLVSDYPKSRKVIMIEGVFFFLSEAQIDSVIAFCREILDSGDVLAVNSFEEATASTEVFDRLRNYFKNELHSEGIATTIPGDFYRNLEGFSLNEIRNTLDEAKQLGLIPQKLEESEVLNEYCYYMIRS